MAKVSPKYYKFGLYHVLVDGQILPQEDATRNGDRLAFAILSDCVGNNLAVRFSAEFQSEVLIHCGVGHEITSDEIQEWIDFKCTPQSVRTPRLLAPDRF